MVKNNNKNKGKNEGKNGDKNEGKKTNKKLKKHKRKYADIDSELYNRRPNTGTNTTPVTDPELDLILFGVENPNYIPKSVLNFGGGGGFNFGSISNSSSRPNKRVKLDDIKLELAPKVSSIKDLIELAKKPVAYKNLDNRMLLDIRPHLEELDNLIGMESLKETIFYQVIYYLQMLHSHSNEEYLHTIITGPPGTGKTTVAKIIGNLYKSMGVLSKNGIFKTASRSDFIGPYLGQTERNTTKLLESCIGGVLFIDELYALGAGKSSNGDSYSKAAIDTINLFLSEHKNDFCCIAAGYEDDIKKCFFSVNKGLERRFNWVHRIEKYTADNLTDIFIKMVDDIHWLVNVDKEKILELLKSNEKLFKHAGGDIETYITKCKMAHSKRVFCLDNEHKFVLTIEDLEEGIKMIKENRVDKEEEENMSHLQFYT